jgi:hypothetical protein
MTLVTVAEFAKEKEIVPITLYKMIQARGIEHIDKVAGVKCPFKLYDRSTLESLFNERAIKKEQSLARAEFKKSRRKQKQPESLTKLNASKLW